MLYIIDGPAAAGAAINVVAREDWTDERHC